MIHGGKQTSKDENEGDYTVKQGDTLSKIAREHYPDASTKELSEKIKEIAKNSGIENPDLIRPGQKIVFGDKESSVSSSSSTPSEPSQTQTDSSSTTSQKEYGDKTDYSERGDTEPDMTENTPNKQETSAAQKTSVAKEKQVTGNEQHSPDNTSNKQNLAFGISLANIETKKGFFKSNNGIKKNYYLNDINEQEKKYQNNLKTITQDIRSDKYKKNNKEYDYNANILKNIDPVSASKSIDDYSAKHPEIFPILALTGIIGGALYLGNEKVRDTVDYLVETKGKIIKPLDENTNLSFGLYSGINTTAGNEFSFYVRPLIGVNKKSSFNSDIGAGNIYIEGRAETALNVYSTKTGLFPNWTQKDNSPFSNLQFSGSIKIEY
ncbi:LysM domain-containing protein [Treponema denticola]|nr:LysM domain-containing protein [Treponema denticola]